MLNILNKTRHLSLGRALENLVDQANATTPATLVGTNQKVHVRPKIGLEVHAQLKTNSKLFSRGENTFQASPNSNVDLLDVSVPGTLPTLNEAAVRAAITTAQGLNCTIQDVFHFDRKNYFYTDMPAGYQITQYHQPIAKGGHIDFIVKTYHNSIIAHSQLYDIVKYLYHEDRILHEEFVPYIKRSHIKQIQLEQDSAKTLGENADFALVDYNRSGAALIEIVFEPDLVNAHEASSLVRDLIYILKQLNTCDCELQEGSLRVDANVSIESMDGQDVAPESAGRVELKNLNSLRSLTKAITSEIQRQANELAAGRPIPSESRFYETRGGRTKVLRDKESAIDYRYVPEPSIPPVRIDHSLVEEIKSQVDRLDLPAKRTQELLAKFDLDLILIAELIEEPGLCDYFIMIMEGHEADFKAEVVADFLIYSVKNLKRKLDKLPIQVDLADPRGDFITRLSPKTMQSLFAMMHSHEISFATAYEVMKCLFTSGAPSEPRQLVEQLNWFSPNDEAQINKSCERIVRGMKNVSKQYKKKGDKKYLRMMLEKLSTEHDHRVNIPLAIKCINNQLRGDESPSE